MPPLGYRKYANKGCNIAGCDQPTYVKGLCTTHYKRQWRHGDNITLIDMTPRIAECSIEDCTNTVYTNESNLCKKHYLRLWRYGRIFNIKSEYGSGTIDSDGYKVYTVNSIKIKEHVFLAEAALGKRLPEKAVVHHMNGDKLDNFTPFNLVICQDQAYHLLLHRRAKELAADIEIEV